MILIDAAQILKGGGKILQAVNCSANVPAMEIRECYGPAVLIGDIFHRLERLETRQKVRPWLKKGWRRFYRNPRRIQPVFWTKGILP